MKPGDRAVLARVLSPRRLERLEHLAEQARHAPPDVWVALCLLGLGLALAISAGVWLWAGKMNDAWTAGGIAALSLFAWGWIKSGVVKV